MTDFLNVEGAKGDDGLVAGEVDRTLREREAEEMPLEEGVKELSLVERPDGRDGLPASSSVSGGGFCLSLRKKSGCVDIFELPIGESVGLGDCGGHEGLPVDTNGERISDAVGGGDWDPVVPPAKNLRTPFMWSQNVVKRRVLKRNQEAAPSLAGNSVDRIGTLTPNSSTRVGNGIACVVGLHVAFNRTQRATRRVFATVIFHVLHFSLAPIFGSVSL